MEMNRRDFIKGILALTALTGMSGTKLLAAVPAPAKQPAPAKEQTPKPQKEITPPGPEYDRSLLINSFFPMLEINEKEVLHFYRDCKKKITVGYGSNVQANSSLLSNITVFHKGKPLTAEEKKAFLEQMTAKSDRNLSGYRISRKDARKMAKSMLEGFVTKLTTIFTNPKTKKSFFFDLPLCMQALCLDVMYNVGTTGFAKFVKFQKAMTDRDFKTATREALVYTDAKKKTTNKNRERLKKRLIRIMRLVQDNSQKSFPEIYASLQEDYRNNVPIQIRLLRGTQECRSEARLAEGEYTHIRLNQLRAQAKTKQAPVPATLVAANSPQKGISSPVRRLPDTRSI